MTYGDTYTAFMRYLVESGTRPKSARSYRRRLPSIEVKLEASGASLLTASDVDLAAVFEADAQTLSPWTLRANWSALRRFYEYALADGLRTDNPTDTLIVSKPGKKPRPLPEPVHELRHDEALLDNWPGARVLFERYLITSGKQPRTAFTYSQAIKLFGRWLHEHEIDPMLLDSEGLRLFVQNRLLVAGTGRVSNELCAIRWFYEWLVMLGRCADNPAASLKVKRGESAATPIVPVEKIKKLLASSLMDRDRLLILILSTTGMRISEAAALRVEEIDWSNGQLLIHGKGNKQRRASLPEYVLTLLRSVINGRRAGPVFVSLFDAALTPHQLYKVLVTAGKDAGVDLAPHQLRASFAVTYLDDTGDVHSLQMLMGHESLATTQRYLTYRDETRSLELQRSSGLARLLSD